VDPLLEGIMETVKKLRSVDEVFGNLESALYGTVRANVFCRTVALYGTIYPKDSHLKSRIKLDEADMSRIKQVTVGDIEEFEAGATEALVEWFNLPPFLCAEIYHEPTAAGVVVRHKVELVLIPHAVEMFFRKSSDSVTVNNMKIPEGATTKLPENQASS